MSEFEEKNIIVKYDGKYKIVDNKMLLREWGLVKRKIFKSIKPLKLFFFLKDKIREIFGEYAISGSFGEYLINGQTQGGEIIIYSTKKEIEKNKEITKYLSKKPNALIFVYDEHIFCNSWKFRGWNLVSIPQLCADLIAQGIYADIGFDLFKRWINDNK